MKRFTATEKWDKEWFQNLPLKQKLLWIYICDKCDNAGVWDANFKLASFLIGEQVSDEDLKSFGTRIVRLGGTSFWIEPFIAFQYGKLSEKCAPHRKTIALIEKHSLSDRVLVGYKYPYERVEEEREREEKDQEEEKEGECEGKPMLETVKFYAATVGLAPWKAEDWFNEMTGCGWLDHNKRPIMDWRAVLRRVKVKWEADGRPTGPPVNRTANGNGAPRPMDIRSIIQAKEQIAVELKTKYSSDVAMGTTWANEEKRKEYMNIKRDIKQLNLQLANYGHV